MEPYKSSAHFPGESSTSVTEGLPEQARWGNNFPVILGHAQDLRSLRTWTWQERNKMILRSAILTLQGETYLLQQALSWTFPSPLHLNSANCSENSATDKKVWTAPLKKTIPSFEMGKMATFLNSLPKEVDPGKPGNSSCLSSSSGCGLESKVMAFISPLTFWHMESWEKKSLTEIPRLVAEIKLDA